MLLKRSKYGAEYNIDIKQGTDNIRAFYPKNVIEELPLYSKTNYSQDYIDKSKIKIPQYNNIEIINPLKSKNPMDCKTTNR